MRTLLLRFPKWNKLIFVFFINYRYFDSIDICKHTDLIGMETRVHGTLLNNGGGKIHIARVTVFTPTEIEFDLFQQGAR